MQKLNRFKTMVYILMVYILIRWIYTYFARFEAT